MNGYDDYDKTCPNCGHTMVLSCGSIYGGALYECLYCGEEVNGDDLPEVIDDESDLQKARCPNGCGISQFRWEGSYLVCSNCSLNFNPSEVSKYSLKKIFGVCSLCKETGIFVPNLTSDEEDYCCSNCGVIEKKDELILVEVTFKLEFGEGKYIGCYNCGQDWEGSESSVRECGGCSFPLGKIKNITRRCDFCTGAGNQTIHLGSWDNTHHFFCFDCQEEFEVPFQKCDSCGEEGCQITDDSTIGYTFHCDKCHTDFIHTGPVFETQAATTRSTSFDDRSWQDYLYKDLSCTIEDSMERKFLVITEV